MEKFEDYVFWLVTSALGAVATAIVWLVRRVLTNHAQIELLKADLEHRDKTRAEDREDLKEVREAVRQIHGVLLGRK